MDLHDGARVGPYRLLEAIGRGGMAQVFAAQHVRMNSKVALKILRPENANKPGIAGRFLQEARALAQLEHPGIVRVLHCEQLRDGVVYLAMEYLDGVSLRSWLHQLSDPPALAVIREISRQVADAMAYVHTRGIVHRDLKPENIILLADSKPTADPYQVKIIDFGIAKMPLQFHSHLDTESDTQIDTRGPVLLGTATYMAPEQCRNAADVTSRTDVYALGVVLFEMLAGRAPFLGEEPIEVISAHVNSLAPSVREYAPQIPVALDVMITSMLAKEPTTRPTMRRICEVLTRPWEDIAQVSANCPFPGLLGFDENDAEIFFGRGREVNAILSHLERAREGGPRCVLVEGPGGAGKTSVVRAGVIPALKDRNSRDVSRWQIVYLRPSGGVIPALARFLALTSHTADSNEIRVGIERNLRENPGAFPEIVARNMRDGCCLLLVIDPLNELLDGEAAITRPLETLLASLLEDSNSPVCILATWRSELARQIVNRHVVATMLQSKARVSVQPLTEQTLAGAIRQMCERTALLLAEGLAERLTRDAFATRDPMPLLGYTLRSLWPSAGKAITHERYDQLGGVAGALAEQAERVLHSLGDEGRQRAKWLLLSLIHVGRGTPDTRVPRTLADVLNAAGGDNRARDILQRLANRPSDSTNTDAQDGIRLITLMETVGPGSEPQVDLAHETLLHQVSTIAGWVDAERNRLERHADLEAAADTWERSGRPSQGLPSGTLLTHFVGERRDPSQQEIFDRLSSDRARAFVRSVRKLERRRKNAWRAAGSLLVAALVVSVALALHARRAQERAEGNLEQILLSTEQVVSEVDWRLSRLHYTLPMRRDMLEHIDRSLAALPFEERSKLDVRRAIIKTKHRLGDLHRHDGTLADAASFYQVAARLIQNAALLWPDEDSLTFLRALNHSKRGKIALASARFDDANHHFNAALSLLAPGLKQADPDSRRTLATSYSEKAELSLAIGRPRDALGLYGHALALLTNNQGDYDRSLQALTLAQRAHVRSRVGERNEATADFRRALDMMSPIVEGDPGNAYFRWTMGYIYSGFAALVAESDQLDQTVAHYRTAYTLGRELLNGDPDHKRYALLVCESLLGYEKAVSAHRPLHFEPLPVSLRCEIAEQMLKKDRHDVRFRRLLCY
ncbi:MAG: protein kinase [Proteobacteria bacterium]|nr:protein kinase [Pseudomonadota bacterium]